MEHTPNAPDLRTKHGTGATHNRRATDYVYQAATVAAALLLLLTVTV